jgi:hypothetical protein
MAASSWNLELRFVGSGEQIDEARRIVTAMRKRGKPVHGDGPWWNIVYGDQGTREAALAALSSELDEIDPQWQGVLTAE